MVMERKFLGLVLLTILLACSSLYLSSPTYAATGSSPKDGLKVSEAWGPGSSTVIWNITASKGSVFLRKIQKTNLFSIDCRFRHDGWDWGGMWTRGSTQNTLTEPNFGPPSIFSPSGSTCQIKVTKGYGTTLRPVWSSKSFRLH